MKSVYDDFVDIIYYKVKVSGGPEDQFIASFFLKWPFQSKENTNRVSNLIWDIRCVAILEEEKEIN